MNAIDRIAAVMPRLLAEALPGIRAVPRYDDPNIVWPEFQGQALVSGTNHGYPGVVGAVVVGESEAAVDEALKLIEIDMEELPVIMDVEDALKPEAPIMRPDQNPKTNRRTRFETVLKHGDVEAGFAQADKIVEWKATTEQDVWAGVEAMYGVAEWKGEYLEVWQHGQNASGMMHALRVYAPVHKIHLHLPYNGAQFGGATYLGLRT